MGGNGAAPGPPLLSTLLTRGPQSPELCPFHRHYLALDQDLNQALFPSCRYHPASDCPTTGHLGLGWDWGAGCGWPGTTTETIGEFGLNEKN